MTGAGWQRGWGGMLFSFQLILCRVRRMPPSPFKLRNLKHFLPPLRKGEGKGGIWDVNKGSLAIVEPGSCEARTDKPKITCIVLAELSLKEPSCNIVWKWLFSAAKSCHAYLKQVTGYVLLAFWTSLGRPKVENSDSKSWFWGKDTFAGWLV